MYELSRFNSALAAWRALPEKVEVEVWRWQSVAGEPRPYVDLVLSDNGAIIDGIRVTQ